MEAQRFPTDYDGIIAGAPVHARTQQLIWQIWIAQFSGAMVPTGRRV
jgi:hypothetical protein